MVSKTVKRNRNLENKRDRRKAIKGINESLQQLRNNDSVDKINNEYRKVKPPEFGNPIPYVKIPITRHKVSEGINIIESCDKLRIPFGNSMTKIDLFKVLKPFMESNHFDFNENDSLETVIKKAAKMIDSPDYIIDIGENELISIETSFTPSDFNIIQIDYNGAEQIRNKDKKLGMRIKVLFDYLLCRDSFILAETSCFLEYTLEEWMPIQEDEEGIENAFLEKSDEWLEEFLEMSELKKRVNSLLLNEKAIALQSRRFKILNSKPAIAMFEKYGIDKEVRQLVGNQVEPFRLWEVPYNLIMETHTTLVDGDFEFSREGETDWKSIFAVGLSQGFLESFCESLNDRNNNIGEYVYLNVNGSGDTCYQDDSHKNYLATWEELIYKIYGIKTG